MEIEESFPLLSNGSIVQVSSAWEHDKETFTIFWFYDHTSPAGTHERYTATSTHELVPAAHYIAQFETAGLKIIDQFGDFNRRPFTRRARSWIIIAQKPVPIVGDIRFIKSSSID